MFSKASQIAVRADVLRLKASGHLPQFGWLDIAQTWTRSCSRWPTEKLAIPRAGSDDLVEYETPIGSLCWGSNLRQYAGLFALEHMRGVYERGPVRVSRGDVVIDLGGQIGSFSRYAFSRGAETVVMFEPEPGHIRCVERCFAKEIAGGRLHLVRAAAWSERTVLRFESSGVESRVSDHGGLEVPARTIDEVVESLKLGRVDFIKADIEGAERVALEGARQTISRFAPKMVLCTYHLPDDPVAIPAAVQKIRAYKVWFNIGRAQAFFAPVEQRR
ncbi:MAG TPA: FkbM family methyltransferase [Candidatus Binatia bacterium]|nr:FkbM family methyltransferase [Candidatus Binatia bacterium]